MKVFAEIEVKAINSGTFKDDDDKTVDFYQVQTIGQVRKRLGDEWVELPDVETLGISKELVDQIEVGKTYTFEVSAKAQTPRSGGFAQVKWRIVALKAAARSQREAA